MKRYGDSTLQPNVQILLTNALLFFYLVFIRYVLRKALTLQQIYKFQFGIFLFLSQVFGIKCNKLKSIKGNRNTEISLADKS